MSKGKEWDFGMGQVKAWVEDGSLCWKQVGQKGSWKIDSITGLEFESGAITAEINVFVGGALAKKLRIPKTKKTEEIAKDLINTIEPMRKNASSNISTADELKKFAELKSQGIITEAEFEAKKKQILGVA